MTHTQRDGPIPRIRVHPIFFGYEMCNFTVLRCERDLLLDVKIASDAWLGMENRVGHVVVKLFISFFIYHGIVAYGR